MTELRALRAALHAGKAEPDENCNRGNQPGAATFGRYAKAAATLQPQQQRQQHISEKREPMVVDSGGQQPEQKGHGVANVAASLPHSFCEMDEEVTSDTEWTPQPVVAPASIPVMRPPAAAAALAGMF
jgi:hypothetical protein